MGSFEGYTSISTSPLYGLIPAGGDGGLAYDFVLLGSLIGVLWILSGNVPLRLGGRSFVIPGYMVWCALASAGTGSWLGWRVGRPLIQLNAERYAQEAELRFALVHLNEHIDAVSLSGGEQDEKPRLATVLEDTTIHRISYQTNILLQKAS